MTNDRAPRPKYRCAFCDHGAPDLKGSASKDWQACPGDPPGELCVERIEFRHEFGDHRRCAAPGCDWAVHFLPLVRAAAAEAQASTGKRFAVVDGTREPVTVIGTFDRLQQAKPFRTRYGAKHRLEWGPTHGQVVVVAEAGLLV